MSARWKAITLILGILSVVAIVAQLALAMMILSGGSTAIRKAHQHTGYLTVAITLTYLTVSLAILSRLPSRRSP